MNLTRNSSRAVCLGWISIVVAIGLILGSALTLPSCAATSGPDVAFRPGASEAESSGDWNDIDAAVLAGTYKAEWVVSAWWWADPNTRIYELRNAHGTAGTLRLHRDSSNPDVSLKLTASIGPFGDAAAEKTVIDGIESRLTALHGVDATPIK